jgi:hypothetical protein
MKEAWAAIYRVAVRERRERNERLGIAEVPGSPVWVYLEVLLHDGSVLKYVIWREGFSYRDQRLLIEPATEGGWAERIFRDSIQRYRFREFADEAAAQAAALASPPFRARPKNTGRRS